MKKITIAIIVSFVILIGSIIGLAIWSLPKLFNNMQRFGNNSTYRDVKVTVPHDFNKQTLAVYNFRPHGDKDTKYYAIGFARALADRIYCAPTSLTQQASIHDINNTLHEYKLHDNKTVSDAVAIKLAKRMGVCWIITGDMTYSRNNVTLNITLTDIRSLKKTRYTAGGSLNDLPAMQSKLIRDLIRGMQLKPTPAQIREVYTPNFTRPQTLESYGKSYFPAGVKECEINKWQALDNDPNASFPVLRLLEFYYYSSSTIPEIQSNKRLTALLADIDERFPNNSQISVLKGLLLNKQCKYAEAEECLSRLVERDPQFIRGNVAFAYNAIRRKNGRLAVSESSELVKKWPNNPVLHGLLAYAYGIRASNTKHVRYSLIKALENKKKSVWRINNENKLSESVIAVKMDPDCSQYWCQFMDVCYRLRRNKDVTTAFNEMIRIDSEDLNAYLCYIAYLPSDYGDYKNDLKRIIARAEAAFGKNSWKLYYIRAWTLIYFPEEAKDDNEVLKNVNIGLSKCKTPDSHLFFLKSMVLYGLKRYDESEKVAREGVQRWDTLEWKFQLAKALSGVYQEKSDYKALAEAEKIFSDYVHEIPFDSYGYAQLGWCLSHQGHRAEAKQKFLKALELDPTNEWAREKLKYVQ